MINRLFRKKKGVSVVRKFILSRKEHRKHLVVSARVHALVGVYAKENGLTIAEATHILLGKALMREYGFSKAEIASLRNTE